jgi:hypothetical protein
MLLFVCLPVKAFSVDTFFTEHMSIAKNIIDEAVKKYTIVYDGMNIADLTNKLNRILKDNLADKGNLIANYSLEKGVDTYLATAIILHETGCAYNCSYLVKACNNVGGQKGYPTCSGAYKGFENIDVGIKAFIDNLYNNYYAYGLVTPELMNPKYAESMEWASKVNAYIERIKAV